MKLICLSLLLLFILLFSCKGKKTEAVGLDGWLKGGDIEKIETVSKHLRGLDLAMVETGYRYSELWWAGQDGNWDYALYQLDKIKLALELGIERRPKRGESAQSFLQTSVPAMKDAIEKKDTAVFNKGFLIFQSACRSCHIAENVKFIQITIPKIRLSSIHYQE
jgi:hypothetical protein